LPEEEVAEVSASFFGGLGLLGAAMVSVAFASESASCGEPPKPLFDSVDMARTELNPKQSRVLDRLSKSPTTMGVHVVKLHEGSLNDNSTPLSVSLQPGVKAQWHGYTLNRTDAGQVLQWKKPDGADSASLSAVDDSLTGMIYQGGKVYSIEPLGKGLHAVVLLNQSQFPGDEPPGKPTKSK
jgi:hypothetical protein